MQPTARSLQWRNIPKTSLNFLEGGEQAEFIVDLAKPTAFHTQEVTGSSAFHLPPRLCFKDSLQGTELSLSNLLRFLLHILCSAVDLPRSVHFLWKQKWLRSNGLVFPALTMGGGRLAAVSVSAVRLQIALQFSNSALRITTMTHGKWLPQSICGANNSNWAPSPQKSPKVFQEAAWPCSSYFPWLLVTGAIAPVEVLQDTAGAQSGV